MRIVAITFLVISCSDWYAHCVLYRTNATNGTDMHISVLDISRLISLQRIMVCDGMGINTSSNFIVILWKIQVIISCYWSILVGYPGRLKNGCGHYKLILCYSLLDISPQKSPHTKFCENSHNNNNDELNKSPQRKAFRRRQKFGKIFLVALRLDLSKQTQNVPYQLTSNACAERNFEDAICTANGQHHQNS